MASMISVLIKKRHVFFLFIVMEILLLGLIATVLSHYDIKTTLGAYMLFDPDRNFTDARILNSIPILPNSSIHFNCTDDPYPNNYYRKPIRRDNYTYYAYAISIGKIFAQYLTPNQTKSYRTRIHNDLLTSINAKHLNRSQPSKAIMYETYLRYYYNFHFPPNSTIRCPNHAFTPNDTIDFFNFIQIDGQYTNENHAPPINFYDLLPMEHVTSKGPYSPVHSIANKSRYIFPKLFSYTLSVNESGDLRSLELRFVEIIDALQHDATRHLLLNGVRGQLLWAGEFYYIYDHKYNQYVLIMDSASGHFRPNIDTKPEYMERILLRTLFPRYGNRTTDTNGYCPVRMIGYHYKPWSHVKTHLFPVIKSIWKRDAQIYWQKRRQKVKQSRMFLNQKPCHILMKEYAQRFADKTSYPFKATLKHGYKSILKLNVTCDQNANATHHGWKYLNEYKEMILYKMLNKY